ARPQWADVCRGPQGTTRPQTRSPNGSSGRPRRRLCGATPAELEPSSNPRLRTTASKLKSFGVVATFRQGGLSGGNTTERSDAFFQRAFRDIKMLAVRVTAAAIKTNCG